MSARFCLGCFGLEDYRIVRATDSEGREHTYGGAAAINPAARDALVECARALFAIRRRIPFDAENEDANGWGRVDRALAEFDETCAESVASEWTAAAASREGETDE